jgi:hypothetical protein
LLHPHALAFVISCRYCDHDAVIDVAAFGDDLPVPSFGPRLRCTVCGHLGADARPNWSDASAGFIVLSSN